MQTSEFNYCGAILDHSVYKCVNCGGLVTQVASINPKQINKKVIFACVLSFAIVIGPIIYKKHINNTAAAVIDKLQTDPLRNSKEDHFEIKAKFSQVLAEIAPIKVAAHEFHMTEGCYPESFHELGINERLFDTGELIQAIKLLKTGSIGVDMAPDIFGEKKFVTLIPKAFMGGMNIKWMCTSNLDRQMIPHQCKSTV